MLTAPSIPHAHCPVLASNALPIGLLALITGYSTQTRAGRARLLEAMFDEPDSDAGQMVRYEASLRRSFLKVPDIGEVAVWQRRRPDPMAPPSNRA